MRKTRLSDQYYDWSDLRHRENLRARTATEKNSTCEPTATPGGCAARLADRAVQALWETGVQMRCGPGAWPEVLPLRQPVGIEAPDGLRALRVSATGAATRGELSTSSRSSQGNLRDQSRTVTTTETTVDRIGECQRHSHAGGLAPTEPGCRSGRQHAPGLFLASTAQPAAGGPAR
jgi:hypothetical protein